MFKLIKEIKSKNGEVHFKRWRIFSTPWFDVNIHVIYKADQDEHLHNHPWNIWTMVLWGAYLEQFIKENSFNVFPRFIFNMAYREAGQYHKILKMLTNKCYTLAIMSKRKQDWGYKVKGKHIQHEEYRKLKREGKL